MSLKRLKFAVGLGLKYFFGGGDFASNQGPMYSPQVFHELMLPRLKKISEACHELDVYHLFGTDGNVWPVAEDLYRNSGMDGHYEFDRRAGMGPLEVHKKYPHLVMVGNISSHTLHTGTPADVEREVRECLDEARQTNKVVTGCSNIIISETPPANIAAMLQAIAKYR
jgi:uroporphyrinogen decarboxylase